MNDSSRRISLHRALSHPMTWVLIAYFGLAGTFLALYVQNGRINAAARLRAAHIAEVHSTAESQYLQCINSIPTLKRVNRFVAGVVELHSVLYRNAVAAHDVTPPGTPLYRAQTDSILRLRHATILVTGVHFAVPTKQSCLKARAATLATLANDP